MGIARARYNRGEDAAYQVFRMPFAVSCIGLAAAIPVAKNCLVLTDQQGQASGPGSKA